MTSSARLDEGSGDIESCIERYVSAVSAAAKPCHCGKRSPPVPQPRFEDCPRLGVITLTDQGESQHH
jgi:hypothetical protein